MSGGSTSLPPPTWMVDRERLRRTLDELRTALRQPIPTVSIGSVTAALAFDRDRVTESVRAIVDLLSKTDLESRKALSSVVTASHDPSQVARLKALVVSLEEAWVRYVETKLGSSKVQSLRRLLRHPAPDVLAVLRRSDDENAHSDLLRWLLDPREARRIGPAALLGLSTFLAEPSRWHAAITRGVEADCISVRREFAFGREWRDSESLDRIDLVVTGPGFVLAIENKVWAPEHESQTEDYWAWLSTLRPLRGGIFLSPTGIRPSCSEFRPMSYIDLLSCLLEAPTSGEIGADEECVLAGYTKTLAANVLRAELRAIYGKGEHDERTERS